LPIAPLTLPSFELMIEDIGASPAELARHLGVDLWTVRSWLRGEPHARRPVLRALFYETKWGRSFVSVRSEYDARH
jgi:predicted transcriptional regulator